ncbi:kinetochore protein Spc25-like [Tubulanus polymorphus]|uniref:kinetochore protein Spc25-like n=1 Tax=Tubulanus polymorphus TaxID=672921 RepID=UPI003DA35FDD
MGDQDLADQLLAQGDARDPQQLLQQLQTHRVVDLESEAAEMSTNLQNIREIVIKTQGAEFVRQLEQEKQAHEERMRRNKEDLAALQASLNQYSEKATQHKEVLTAKSKCLEDLKSGIDAVRRETDQLLMKKEQLANELIDTEQETSAQTQLCSTQLDCTEAILKELQIGVQCYREYLGLDIQKTAGEKLQFAFVNVDEKAPDKRFCFSVRLTGENSYEVSDCCPEVVGLEELVDKLNTTNSLRSFVVEMRKRFKLLVAENKL